MENDSTEPQQNQHRSPGQSSCRCEEDSDQPTCASSLLTSSRIVECLFAGGEPAELMQSCHDVQLCQNDDLFNSLVQIGQGRNGTVYSLRSTKAKQFFGCLHSVVLKEIRSRHSRTIEHLHRPSRRPDGHYTPVSQNVSEALNGALATQLYDQGASPHFVRQICLFTCKTKCYLVYEFCGYRRKNDTLRSVTLAHLPKVLPQIITEQIVGEILFVILHSLWIAQSCYGQVHYDLKPDNIFIQPITKATEFNGVRLADVQYFGYCLADSSGQRYCYYLPNRGYLIKIGDYGTMVSNSVTQPHQPSAHPISVMPQAVWDNSAKLKDEFGISRDFKCGYDAHFFIPQLIRLCSTWGVPVPAPLLHMRNVNNIQVDPTSCRPCNPVLNKSPFDLIVETSWTNVLTSKLNAHERAVYVGTCLWT